LTKTTRQTDRQTENQRQTFETLLKRDGPVQRGFLFQADSSKPRFVHWWKRSLSSLDEDDQTDRQTDRQTENQRQRFETLLKRDGRVQRGFLFQADSSKRDSSTGGREVFVCLTKTTRQTENQRQRFETILKRDGRVQRIPKEPAVAAAARGGGEQEGFWLRR
jgi:hypothetical protein